MVIGRITSSVNRLEARDLRRVHVFDSLVKDEPLHLKHVESCFGPSCVREKMSFR